MVLCAGAATLALAAVPATAQYQWRDTAGRMVFSDQPPPASVDPKRIVKAPTAPLPLEAQAAPAAAATAGAAKAAPTVAERELAYRKRQAEQAEQEKKAAEESRRKLDLARACADTQADIRSLESGQRISRINAAGEREFLAEAERAQRLKDARKNVGERC